MTWTADDPAICTVDNGVLNGLSNGETLIHGTLDDLKCSLKVRVQIPEAHTATLLPLKEDSWSVKSSSNIKDIQLLDNGIKYTYSSGRSPYIELINAFEFYSLPEAIRFVINPGNAAISKVVVSGKENLATSSSIYEYNNELSKNADTEILLSMKEWFSKETVEHALFPVHFNSIKFPFVASGNPIGENVFRLKIWSWFMSRYL